MQLKEILNQIHPLPDAVAEAVERECETERAEAGVRPLEQGKRCYYLYFIKEGIMRVTYAHDGEEDTIAFGTTGDVFTSAHAFFANETVQFSMECLEECTFYRISFERFKDLLRKHHELSLWLNHLLMEQIYAFEKRYVHLGNSDAYERYVKFIRLRSEVINRIPLKYVAQYLNMVPATLSRVRRRFGKAGGAPQTPLKF
jgi:hypothetical protein